MWISNAIRDYHVDNSTAGRLIQIPTIIFGYISHFSWKAGPRLLLESIENISRDTITKIQDTIKQ